MRSGRLARVRSRARLRWRNARQYPDHAHLPVEGDHRVRKRGDYDYHFEIGKAKLLHDGAEVLIVSSGIMTMPALETAKALAADHIGVGVLHVPTIKPLDTPTILREAGRTGRLVVVAENHSTIGGPGEAVATALPTAGVAPRYRQIALPDAFLAAGALPTLHDRYGLSTDAMVATITGWLG